MREARPQRNAYETREMWVSLYLQIKSKKMRKKQTDLFHPSLSHGHSPVLSLSGPQSLAYSNNIRKRAIFMSTGRQACCIHLLPSSAISLPISCPCWVSTKNLLHRFGVRMAFSGSSSEPWDILPGCRCVSKPRIWAERGDKDLQIHIPQRLRQLFHAQ